MTTAQLAFAEATTLHRAGLADPARRAYLGVLDALPSDPFLFARVGISLVELGFFEDAEAAFKGAVRRFPQDAAAYHNLGGFYTVRKHFREAERAFRRAIELGPGDADTLYALGGCCMSQGRNGEAEEQFRGALQKDPGNPAYSRRLGMALANLSRFEEALPLLQRSFDAEPGDIVTRGALGAALTMLGRPGEHVALIEDFAADPQPLDDSVTKMVLDLFVNPALTVEDEGRLIPRLFSYLPVPPASGRSDRRPAGAGRIRVGYLSSFMNHANYMDFLEPIAAGHDRDRFDIRIYADSACDTGRFSPGNAGCVVKVAGMTNAALVEKIRSDRIDILVDLNGFGTLSRLAVLAAKPAPVIASWYNAFSTLGLDAVDYLIGDDIVAPASEDRHYREGLYRLPGCYLYRHRDGTAPPVGPLPMSENGHCTFGSLAAAHKVHRGCLQVWSRILKSVPGSRLVLRNAGTNEDHARFLLRILEEEGIDQARVDILPPAGHHEFLETYDRIDIALDSFAWNGGTTTMEAMWQGVPVVCYRGDRWASRAGVTLVSAVGHSEWAGRDLDDYVRIAVELAGEPDRLARTRAGLRDEMAGSPLCDDAAFVEKLEEAYLELAAGKGIVP